METFTKDIVTEHYNVTLTFRSEPYGSEEQKVFVQFDLDGDGFSNAEVLPKSIEMTPEHPVIEKLEAWATTIINDREATKKRQEEEAAAEEAEQEDNQE